MKWFKGKEELKPSPKYNMEVTPKTAVLTVKNAEKEDESDYRAELENNLGKDKVDMKAEVVEKEGKLRTDITCVIMGVPCSAQIGRMTLQNPVILCIMFIYYVFMYSTDCEIIISNLQVMVR